MTTTTKKRNGAPASAPITEDDVRTKLTDIIDKLCTAFTGRDAVVRGIICALLAGEEGKQETSE